ncbi:MAG: hypothetical protein PHV35_09090 [Mariniphaga sp.]|nr:hypothetical protein [Mariniphaga sp.]
MKFFIDNQTLNDLELFPIRGRANSIFDCYNCTETKGGSEILHKYFRLPVADINFLEQRKQQITFFIHLNTKLKLSKRQFDFVEHYLKNRRMPLRDNILDATKDGILNKINPDGDYYIITNGVYCSIFILSDLQEFLAGIADNTVPESLKGILNQIGNFLKKKTISKILDNPPEKMQSLSSLTINRLDNYFRVKKKTEFRNLLDKIYELDVLQSMSSLMQQKNYSLPEYVKDSEPVFEATDFFHPFLDEPVCNSFSIKTNLCFLTGPNMSGKSTFLKTVGLMVYLSQIGLPVPAKKFKTSIQNGLFTTINLADSINLGFNHFYAEVKRVKEMAINLQTHKKLVVIFDELFRGTNVKDAFEATLLIIKSLAAIKSSLFFASSHLLEVAMELIHSETIDFKCFETILKNEMAEYDYKLKIGISSERVGLKIIESENIKAILESVIEQQQVNTEKID